MASAGFVIEIIKDIDVYLELILVQMDIVWLDWVRRCVEMVELKHFFFVKTF